VRASQMASAAPATIRRLLSFRARLVLAATCSMVDRLSPWDPSADRRSGKCAPSSMVDTGLSPQWPAFWPSDEVGVWWHGLLIVVLAACVASTSCRWAQANGYEEQVLELC